jgi:hypothetical protein
MGRKSLNDEPMTPEERQQRRRNRYKAAVPPRGTKARFRFDLLRYVESERSKYEGMSVQDIDCALSDLGMCLRMENFDPSGNYIARFLSGGLGAISCDPEFHGPVFAALSLSKRQAG